MVYLLIHPISFRKKIVNSRADADSLLNDNRFSWELISKFPSRNVALNYYDKKYKDYGHTKGK